MVRQRLASSLRDLADVVRPGEVVQASGHVPAEGAPRPMGTPEWMQQTDSAELSDEDAAMALMAGLSGDMGPAIASRVSSGGDDRANLDASGDPETVDEVVDALHTIFDPEIPVDIYELGLIYGVDVREDRSVGVRMTLTSPNCPAAQSLPAEVEQKVSAVPGVTRTDVDVVFEPAWTPDLMSEAAKLELNML